MDFNGTQFFQVGLIVEDLELAMEELGQALDLTWTRIVERTYGEWGVRMVFSHEGPPHIELIEGSPGSPWEADGGPRVDHLGYWSRDLDADAAELESRGWERPFDGREFRRRVLYQRAPAAGLTVELVGLQDRPAFLEHYGLEDRGSPWPSP